MKFFKYYTSFFVGAALIIYLNAYAITLTLITYFYFQGENVYMAVVITLACAGTSYLAIEVLALKLSTIFDVTSKIHKNIPILMSAFSIVFGIPWAFSGVYLSFDKHLTCFNLKDFTDYQYFSFTTFSTLGYGDVAPVGICRNIAVTEAMLGLLVLPLLVALGMKFLPTLTK